jgi:hypothetical protein
MGFVAGLAPVLLQYVMDHFVFIFFLAMALITILLAFRFQQVLSLGSVRIVTGNAVPLPDRGVNAFQVQAEFFLAVAGKTDFFPGVLQQQLRHDSMPEMAIFALPLLYACMDGFHGQILLCELLVAIQAAFPFELPFLGPCVAACADAHGRDREYDGQRIKDST